MTEHGHPESTSTRPERNGECATCHGQIRHYPPPASGPGPGAWSHLNRADWMTNPHDPNPTAASIEAAQVGQPAGSSNG